MGTLTWNYHTSVNKCDKNIDAFNNNTIPIIIIVALLLSQNVTRHYNVNGITCTDNLYKIYGPICSTIIQALMLLTTATTLMSSI